MCTDYPDQMTERERLIEVRAHLESIAKITRTDVQHASRAVQLVDSSIRYIEKNGERHDCLFCSTSNE